MLIEYFGQEIKEDCGMCDVCLRKRNSSNLGLRKKAVESHITGMLQEKGEMTISQIETAAGDEYKLYLQVVREMIDNGAVICFSDTIHLS